MRLLPRIARKAKNIARKMAGKAPPPKNKKSAAQAAAKKKRKLEATALISTDWHLEVQRLLQISRFDDALELLTGSPEGQTDWGLMKQAEIFYHKADYLAAASLIARIQSQERLAEGLNLKLRTGRQSVVSSSGVTVVLTSYRRPQNIAMQLAAIQAQSVQPEEILLWHNHGGDDVELPNVAGTHAAVCTFNFKFFSRFAFALLAKTKYVAIFDDDTIPGARWLENCLNTIKTHPGILTTSGVLLERQDRYRPHTKVGWNGSPPNKDPQEVDIGCQGWFLEKSWLRFMWAEAPTTWDNGEDIHLSYTAKKYGGIRTFVPPHPESDESLWGSTMGRELGDDAEATHVQHRVNQHFGLRASEISVM